MSHNLLIPTLKIMPHCYFVHTWNTTFIIKNILMELTQIVSSTGGARKFSCLQCNREFVNNRNLTVHMRDAHGEDRGPFSCPYCSKLSKNRSSLRNHVYNIHSIRAKAVTEIWTPKDPQQPACWTALHIILSEWRHLKSVLLE